VAGKKFRHFLILESFFGLRNIPEFSFFEDLDKMETEKKRKTMKKYPKVAGAIILKNFRWRKNEKS